MFLNGPLEEEIYMRKPGVIGPGIWHLRKGLYGLKQSGRTWYLEFNEKFQSIGFKRCKSDWSVHRRGTVQSGSMTATSVDDILLSSSSQEESDNVTSQFGGLFDLTDGGEVQWLLGRKLARDRK